MNVVVSQILGNAYAVSEIGVLYSSLLLENGEYLPQNWTKVLTVNQNCVAEIESVVVSLINESEIDFVVPKTRIINNILHIQLEVITD